YGAAEEWELLWAATGHNGARPMVIGDAVVAASEKAITIFAAATGEEIATVAGGGDPFSVVFDGERALGVRSKRTDAGSGAFQDQTFNTAAVYSVTTGEQLWSHEVPDTDTLHFIGGVLVVS